MGNSLQRREQERGISPEEPAREVTCEICIEPFYMDKLLNNNNRCVHPFCLDCMAKYIEVKVDDHIGNIPCPALNCNQLLDPMFWRAIISEQLFNKWCDALCASTVLEFQYRSYCPYTGCSALVISECGGKSLKKVKCPNCKKDFCFKCQIPWHAGYKCEQSGQLKDMNDFLFGQIIERNGWRKCTRCGQCVERVGGCMTIHCRCGAYFRYASASRKETIMETAACIVTGLLAIGALGVLYFFLIRLGQRLHPPSK